MIQYNVTVTIDATIEESWLKWMLEEHIPEVLRTGLFLENKVTRMLSPASEPGYANFSFQYICKDMDTLQIYLDQFAPALQESHATRYANRFAAFRSIMEVI